MGILKTIIIIMSAYIQVCYHNSVPCFIINLLHCSMHGAIYPQLEKYNDLHIDYCIQKLKCSRDPSGKN